MHFTHAQVMAALLSLAFYVAVGLFRGVRDVIHQRRVTHFLLTPGVRAIVWEETVRASQNPNRGVSISDHARQAIEARLVAYPAIQKKIPWKRTQVRRSRERVPPQADCA